MTRRSGPWPRRGKTAVVVVAVVAAFVLALYQPWLAQWGSTAAERRGPVAGDGLVADADTTWTRSVTIDAPPSEVWPWLVQMGVDRGGFANYDWGEQLFLDPIHNATTIHPEWQHLAVGDAVHPKPGGDWKVVALEPERTLVLTNPLVTPTDWSWAIELRPRDGGHGTRLVTRIRSHKGSVFSYALDVPDLILFPRLLTGIEQRAEGTLPGMPGTARGEPFPMARLPVHWWAAIVWILGLALVGRVGRSWLGRWRHPRPHPHLTWWLGFVIGAGYLLMSDTPPIHFLSHSWGAGLVVGPVLGVVLARRSSGGGTTRRPVSRIVAALVEAGVFVLLPATAVWQAATARGWTDDPGGHLVAAAAAGAVAVAVARMAWSGPASVPLALAAAYAITGSGLAVGLAVLVLEVAPGRAASPAGHRPDDEERLAAVGDGGRELDVRVVV